MNMNLNFKFDPALILKYLRPAIPYITGVVLVGLFGYTGWVINQAFNVQPAEATATVAPKISFDKTTIETIKNLQVVPGQVPTGSLGSNDPFGN